jgi:uncharacterized protein YggU (UPF0235/DUF167 family)
VSGFDARRRGQAVRFSVHLHPRASKNEIVVRRNVCIVSGLSSRAKVVEIGEVELETIQRLAG